MNTNLSFSVFTANLISLLLLGTLYFSNRQKKSHDGDMRIILRMMVITAISNVADLCVLFGRQLRNAFIHSGVSERIMALYWECSDWLYMGTVYNDTYEHPFYKHA